MTEVADTSKKIKNPISGKWEDYTVHKHSNWLKKFGEVQVKEEW